MKVLFTQETDWIRSNPTQQHHLAEMLSLKGHEIRVIDSPILKENSSRKGTFSKRKILEKVTKIHEGGSVTVIRPGIINLPLINHMSLFYSHRNEINRQIREFKPEVIVGWGVLNSYLGTKAANKNNIPFVYYWVDVLHSLIPNRLFFQIWKMAAEKALQRSDLVSVINEKLADYVVSMGASADRMQVLPAGIELGRFRRVIDIISIRKKFDLDKFDRILLFAGPIHHYSGLGQVFKELSKTNNPKLKLLIVGEGDAYNDLMVLRDRYKLGNRVILTGKRDDSEIPGLIAAADICILPTDPSEPRMQDIVPINIYEYMAMRKPVIATRLPGVTKQFGEVNGVISVDKASDVVKAAESLFMSGSGYMFKLGSNARKCVEKNDWTRVVGKFEAALYKVMEIKRVKDDG